MALDERLYRIVEDPAGSDTVWFVFSARSVPVGKFSMSGVMRELPGDKVFFNCIDNSWFLDIEDKIDAKIAEVLAAKPYARRLFVGTSMGGAGALMFAPRHDATRLLAFSLNTLVGERFTHSALYIKDHQRDLLSAVTPGFAARCTAILGVTDPADAETARRLMRARVETRLMRCNHDTAGTLARHEAIVPLLRQFERGEPVVLPEELQASREEMRLSHTSLQILQRIDAAGAFDRDTLRALARMDQRFAKEIVRKLTAQASSDHLYEQAFAYAVAVQEAGLEYDFIVPQLLNAAFRLRNERCRTAAFYIPTYLATHDSERARLLAYHVATMANDADALALVKSPDAIDHMARLAVRAAQAGSQWAALDIIRRIPRLSRGARENFLAAQAAGRLGFREEALGFARAAAKAAPREERYAALAERLGSGAAVDDEPGGETSGDGQAG